MSIAAAEPRACSADRRRPALGLLILVWGAQAIVTQALLLREALVLLFGSEFAWGVVLFAWLLGVALGAVAGGRLAEAPPVRRNAALVLVLVLLALSAAACLELWAFRGARGWLGVAPGQFLPLAQTALVALLLVSPASALVGLAFPLACAVRRDGDAGPPLLTFGQIYAFESAGSLLGGAGFSFWAVEQLSPIQTALLCGALTAVAAAGVIRHRRPALRHVLSGLLILVALIAGVTAVRAGDALNRALVSRRWQTIAPGYDLVAETESKYQNLAVGRRAGQYTLYCDGQVTGDFPDPYTYAPLAHFWLCEHPQPRRVLVLGGGAEGLLGEILLHPVEHIDYVEPDPRQIELLRPLLSATDQQALADPRVTVHFVDARYYVKTQEGRFDLVIARLPEPTSALRARFYTAEFFGELRRAMTPSAVLCLTAAAAPTELSVWSREYLASLRATLCAHFPQVVIGWGDPAQVLAATGAGLLTTEPAELSRRYAERGVRSELFDPAWFAGATDWLDAAKLTRREADLDAGGAVPISTDLRPTLYVQRLALWEAQTGGTSVLARLRSVGVGWLAGALAVTGGLTLLITRLRRGPRDGWALGSLTLSVGTTGFATMAVSLIGLFAFQNLYGYVYQRIGWIIALFMAGLVLGCTLGARRTRAALPHRTWRDLVLVDMLLAGLALAIPFTLPALGRLQSGPATLALVEACVSLLLLMTGVLGGVAFALAGCLRLGFGGQSGAAAGSVVGADHAGACLGALLCGLLLVPIFGTAVTAFLLAGMKISSAGMLLVGWRLTRGA